LNRGGGRRGERGAKSRYEAAAKEQVGPFRDWWEWRDKRGGVGRRKKEETQNYQKQGGAAPPGYAMESDRSKKVQTEEGGTLDAFSGKEGTKLIKGNLVGKAFRASLIGRGPKFGGY